MILVSYDLFFIPHPHYYASCIRLLHELVLFSYSPGQSGKPSVLMHGKSLISKNFYWLFISISLRLSIVFPRNVPFLLPTISDFPSVSISEIPTGIIKLKNNGDFFIANEGRRPIYIDGRPVLSGNKWKLNNNSVVEVGNAPLPSETNTSSISLLKLEQRVCVVQIAGLRFVFLINLELISLIKAEAAKMTQQ